MIMGHGVTSAGNFVTLVSLWLGIGALSAAGVAVLERWAQRRSILDIPNARSSHRRPTPRGGGLAIILSIGIGWFVLEAWVVPGALHWALVVGLAVIALVSWIDDMRGVSTGFRFFTHTLAAVIVIWTGGYWSELLVPGVGRIHLDLGGAILSILWIVGLTNAFNFMDGIDGIAGVQGVAAGVGWALIGAWLEWIWLLATGGLIAASALAFLYFNWSPARIFMGDVGSASLGFLFAALPFFVEGGTSSNVVFRLPLAAALLLWPSVFDTIYTFLRRLIKRENVFAAHRSHLYQRLVIAGWSHQTVSFLYSALACSGFVGAIVWLRGTEWLTSVTFVGVVTLALILVATVHTAERLSKESEHNSATV